MTDFRHEEAFLRSPFCQPSIGKRTIWKIQSLKKVQVQAFRSSDLHVYSKSPHIKTYFFESQAEISSYFKGIKTNFKL